MTFLPILVAMAEPQLPEPMSATLSGIFGRQLLMHSMVTMGSDEEALVDAVRTDALR